MLNDRGMFADEAEFFFAHDTKLMLWIVDKNCVFQIQSPGAWVQVIAGQQHPLIINPHAFQMIAVIIILP